MPHLYPKNSYVTDGKSRLKVLEELGDLRFLSVSLHDALGPNEHWETKPACGNPWHVAELEREGWKVEGEAWKPKDGEIFFYVMVDGEVSSDFFRGASMWCAGMLDAGNCYRTREEAEQAAERVRKAYRG